YETCKLGRYPNFPPYGVGILASRMRKLGVTVDILNLNHMVLKACRKSENEESFDLDAVTAAALKEKIESFKPDFAGVTCMFSQSHSSMQHICGQIREVAPKLPVGLGGVHVTNSL